MGFKRHVFSHLKSWKENIDRKPLIIGGARQVGKTTLIKQFSELFPFFISLNLEKESSKSFFDDFDDVQSIVEAIFLTNNLKIEHLGETLLFLDEIQESPKAIRLLRYFYEEMPKLYVVAAGSLLEFAMKEVSSFPVGRVQFLYLHPMNFPEYLEAIGQNTLVDQLNLFPIRPAANKVLMDLFHRFAIIGGMPEIIKTDIEKKNLADLTATYESIWGTYKYDVEKYTSNETERKIIKHIMNAAPLELDKRVKFQGFGNSNYKSREVGECFRILDDARVIKLIYPTTDLKPPVQYDLKKSPRLQFLDYGLVNYSLGIQGQLLKMEDLSPAFKGALIPHLVIQELLSVQNIRDQKPSFWVREKKQSTAEVDLVYVFEDKLIPVEIKSGPTGSLRSLHQFIDAADHHFAIRVYGGKLLKEEAVTPSGKPYILLNLPYYLGSKIGVYAQMFVEDQI
ncbi:AAA family ATPase [Belliella sp. R4-6]|uniref:AAA family ATPase n=1 Tax=Belliella alkalica TaxID=1730871 RepID=A0ABS9VEI9_9BACT|nr:AAA family ATPase [Belliella alkalica]MCH7414860.1 AAA family ATPase [Belliella alkalica]